MATSWKCNKCGKSDKPRGTRWGTKCGHETCWKKRGGTEGLQLRKPANKQRKIHPSDLRSPIPSSSSSNNNNNNNNNKTTINQRLAANNAKKKVAVKRAIHNLELERKILKSLGESNKDMNGYQLKCLAVRKYLANRIASLKNARRTYETTVSNANEAADDFGFGSGKTIRRYYHAFKKSRLKGFAADKRGSYKRKSIIDDIPEVKNLLCVWLRMCKKRSVITGVQGTKVKTRNYKKFPEISANSVMNHVNKLLKKFSIKSDWALLRPDENNEEIFEIKLTTATKLLHDLGYERTRDKKGYVDNHERPDVVSARNEYVKIKLEDEKLQCLWTDTGEHVDIWSRKLDAEGKDWCRIDSFGEHGGFIHRDMEAEMSFEDRLKSENPAERPKKQLMGDETVYVPRGTTKDYWAKKGHQNMMPKDNRGRGTMLSGIIFELSGQLNVTEEQLITINDKYNQRHDLPNGTKHLKYHTNTSYTRFDYGSNHDGYWTATDVLKYHELIIDIFETLWPGFQAILDVDQSLNHVCFADDALRANVMNSGWGGKQPKMRDFQHTFINDDGSTEEKTIHMVFKDGEKPRTCWGGKKPQVKPASCVGQPIGLKELAYRLKLLDPPMDVEENEEEENEENEEEENDVLLGEDDEDMVTRGRKGRKPKQTQKIRDDIRDVLDNVIERLSDQQMKWFKTRTKGVHYDYCGCAADVDGELKTVRGCGLQADTGTGLFPCNYCYSAWHVGCVRNLLPLESGEIRTQAPDGIYACEECIEAACDHLQLPHPKYPVDGWWKVTKLLNRATEEFEKTENIHVLKKMEEDENWGENNNNNNNNNSNNNINGNEEEMDDDAENSGEEESSSGEEESSIGEEESSSGEEESDSDIEEEVEVLKEGSKKWFVHHISQIPAFKQEMSKLGELVRNRGHILRFIPKYHCEMNCIELYWGRSKMWVRKHTDGTFYWLTTQGIWESLEENNIPLRLRQRFARKQREFVRAYAQEGVTSRNVDAVRESFKAEHLQRKWIVNKIMAPNLRHGGQSSTHINIDGD
jgi:hypothetical protein